ncbi:uncharacterized protein NEMAJ01_0258 [Nematocida major]|uniref:uncharacterized protein n=1 Tax=Nematocida major TaxID=1912982 RepID=UPI002007AFE1|nr:uncharacterized protein NEMAJ01_0258 [Nematocida major]KAH9385362.1 hypothetical protein NEMAJ01_0258 [Nematocida major]
MENAGVNLYTTRRVISRKLISLILVIGVICIAHICSLFLIFFTDPDSDFYIHEYESGITIVCHANFISSYALIAIQGLLERDIFQVMFSTIFASILSVLQMIVSFRMSIELFSAMYISSTVLLVLCGCVVVGIICFTNELRAEIGWFYYKSYGASYNTRKAIERSTSTFFKLNIQFFVSYFIYMYMQGAYLWITLTVGAMYAILIVLNVIKQMKGNNVLIQIGTILMTSFILAYYVGKKAFPDLLSSRNYETPSEQGLENAYRILEVGIRLAVIGIYLILLLIELVYIKTGWGKKAKEDRKRMII